MKFRLALASIVLVPFLSAGGCVNDDPCQLNPTKQASDGTWVEADGEPMDDDPCDADDGFRKPKALDKKTTPKPKTTKK